MKVTSVQSQFTRGRGPVSTVPLHGLEYCAPAKCIDSVRQRQTRIFLLRMIGARHFGNGQLLRSPEVEMLDFYNNRSSVPSLAARGSEYASADDVFQLADISRPLRRHQPLARILGEAHRSETKPLPRNIEEIDRQASCGPSGHGVERSVSFQRHAHFDYGRRRGF
jgi:hypothetical protein